MTKNRKRHSIADSYKRDFLQSTTSSKGTSKDPLRRQAPNSRVKLTEKQISDLYAANGIFANLVDIPAEDCVRAWVDIEGVDDNLRLQVLNKLSNLNAQTIFKEMLKYERLRGDGFISIGAIQKGTFNITEPIGNLVDIKYLHPFSSTKIKDMLIEDDVFSENYGDVIAYEVKNSGGNSVLVDKSRLLHLKTRNIEDEKFGIPIIVPLYDILTILDNAAWSTGQLMYSMVHKVLKSDLDLSDKKKRQNMQADLEYEFNTLSLALLGKDDELQYIGPSVSMPLNEMYTFIWELLSSVARMPKSHIMGQQQGTITGGQYDSLNYYMRIAGIQEGYLREPLEYLIDLLLKAEASGVGDGVLNPENVPYKLKFNSLWKLDDKTDAEIRKLNADIDHIYITDTVLSPGEVREKRFNEEKDLLEELDISEEDLKNLDDKVKEAMNNASES